MPEVKDLLRQSSEKMAAIRAAVSETAARVAAEEAARKLAAAEAARLAQAKPQ